MTAIVIDASVTLAWCFDDEATEATERLLDAVASDGAVVPLIWRLEVANVLVAAERRKRIPSAEIPVRLGLLGRLPIEVDISGEPFAWTQTLDLARKHGLTLYDASYLDLALHSSLPLASRDAPLAGAARAEGVRLLA